MPDDWIPTRKECLDMITEANFPEIKIDGRMPERLKDETIVHSMVVEELAMYYGRRMKELGWGVNLDVLDAGTLLHDIGKTLRNDGYGTHDHYGGLLLKALDVHRDVVHIVESHSAIPVEWVRKFRKIEGYGVVLEDRDYIPRTLEAEVVCYVDKLTEGSGHVTLAEWMKEHNRDDPDSKKVRSKEYFEGFQRDFMIALHEKFMVMTEVPYEEYVKYEKSPLHHGRHKRIL